MGEPANRRTRRRGIGERAEGPMGDVRTFRDLDVYRNAMDLAMRLFDLSRRFPPEERFSLTDQIRRCSRSVCTNIAEAWRKRRYRAAFVSKLSDAETEAAETQVWAEFAFRCRYLDRSELDEIDDACDKVMSQIVKMVDHPEKWMIRPRSAADA
jgi:four helix bundle protein